MAQAINPTDEQLDQAAELRAKGSSWEAVAREIGISASTLRRWPTTQADRWVASFRHAETEVFTEAVAEAIGALRKQLRGDKLTDVRDAAKHLLDFKVQLQKLLQQGAITEQTGMDQLLLELSDGNTNSQKAARQPEEDDPRCAA